MYTNSPHPQDSAPVGGNLTFDYNHFHGWVPIIAYSLTGTIKKQGLISERTETTRSALAFDVGDVMWLGWFLKYLNRAKDRQI